jgi:alkylation response protein AidB-like acyl-CoA dehydrogenase
MSSAVAATPSMDLVPSQEEALLREAAIQTHGGNGVALEYGLADMWWGVRTMRIAPVSREMILNYVAEHSLGLPRSY